MAVFKSGILTQASGSVGGLTFSHNQGGMYMRARRTPTNPNSPQQAAVRALVAQLTSLWTSTLTQVQRASWGVYALNVPLISKVGDSQNVSGLNMYVRSNVPRIQSGLPRIDTIAAPFDLGDFTFPTFGVDATADEADVTFTNTDAWANEDDSSMLVYASRPVSPSVFFFKGPYRFAGRINGDAVTPPTSPAAIALPFAVAPGERIFIKVSVSRADGRLSTPFRGFGDGA